MTKMDNEIRAWEQLAQTVKQTKQENRKKEGKE
jgi:hypothetical protein